MHFSKILLQVNSLSSIVSYRDCCIKFATGINIKIRISQKVYAWSSCSFAKMTVSWEDHFGKITAWSLIYVLSFACYHIYPSCKFDATVSNKNWNIYTEGPRTTRPWTARTLNSAVFNLCQNYLNSAVFRLFPWTTRFFPKV